MFIGGLYIDDENCHCVPEIPEWLNSELPAEVAARLINELGLNFDGRNASDPEVVAVRAAYAYERKSQLSFIGMEQRNLVSEKHRGAPIFLQVSYVLESHDDAYEKVDRVGAEMNDLRLAEKRAELAKQREELDRQMAKLEEEEKALEEASKRS